ncbi:Aste57867_23593 [Aphanomyces stellatus]|uniref:Aste57867_23593 protein n=1 Tax=Aphanomyces stellatus TaxID=120398 RepID=A0A485LPS0_9STRA|nr:hypothetical protein As57867_023521 [Aphanomyces stellatus]VFU00238.1 Aste57867_23593 [Aphanomyces stellatus]
MVLDVVDALSDFMAKQGETDNEAVWFCMFYNNQHLINDDAIPFQFWVDSFETSLTADPKSRDDLESCVFEIYMAVNTNAQFEVAMGMTQKQEILQDILGTESASSKMLGTVKSETSKTAVASDRDNILALMEQTNVTWGDLDRMLFDVLEAWMTRTLQTQINRSVAAEKAQSLCVMSNVLSDKSEFDEAKRCIVHAVDIFRVELGDQHVDTWKAVRLDTALDYMLGQLAVWEPKFIEEWNIQIHLLGRDHNETLLTMLEFATGYNHTYNEKAQPLLKECFERCDRVLGEAHEVTLIALRQIGTIYLRNKSFGKAEHIFLHCLERWRRTGNQDCMYAQDCE